MEYTLQIIGTISAPRLSEKITAPSDAEAIEKARTMAAAFSGVRWFMAVTVWRQRGTTEEVIGSVTLVEEPVTRVTMGGGRR